MKNLEKRESKNFLSGLGVRNSNWCRYDNAYNISGYFSMVIFWIRVDVINVFDWDYGTGLGTVPDVRLSL
jgi:hypothetical protein